MFRQLILVITAAFLFVTPLVAITDVKELLPIERQLIDEIFCSRFQLNERESDLLLDKLRIVEKRSDYEALLLGLYKTVINLNPKPFDASLWHDDEDALVAEPTHKVLIENPYVRILEVVIPPGYHQAYHTHRWAGVTIDLVPSDFILYNDQGQFLLHATDDPIWHHDEGQTLHTTKNIGEATYIGLHIELKN